MNQSSMNFDNKDLPLFSGTPQTLRHSIAQPMRSPSQKSLFNCRFCYDTGRIIVNNQKRYYCTCPRGQEVAKEHKNEA